MQRSGKRANNHHLDGELFDELIGYPAIGPVSYTHLEPLMKVMLLHLREVVEYQR